MSNFLSKHSHECASSELDLFGVQPTQTSILAAEVVTYEPIADNKTGPFEFRIEAVPNCYIDLSQTFLKLQVQIVDAQNKDVDDNTLAAAPANLFMHTLFQQVDMQLNGEKITSSVNNYPYRAYFETLLNYGIDSKKSHLATALYYKDDAGRFDVVQKVEEKDKPTPNNGFIARRNKATKGIFEMFGRLHMDIFFQDKYLLDNIAAVIKLTKSPDAFCLIGPDAAKHRVIFHKAQLMVRQCEISNTVKLAHALALEKATAKYPIKRVELSTISVNKGISSCTLSNIVNGLLPTRIVFGLIENSAYTGTYSKNCFNFQHFNVTEVGVHVNGRHAPGSPLTLDYAKNLYTTAYYSLFSGIDRAPLDLGIDISYEEYPQGYCLYAFDLTPDMCLGDHLNLRRSGVVKLELKFSTPTTSNLECVFYMDFENIIEISKSRKVLTDFTI